MTLQEVKQANPEFFNDDISDAFRDSEVELLPSDDGPVLRITSSLGTRPVYAIDGDTLRLSYLRHDEDIILFESDASEEGETTALTLVPPPETDDAG